MRFVPYPVIAGFLAGTGWLVVNGAFGILTGLDLTPGAISTLLAPDFLLRWAPALGFAAVLLAVLRHWSHPLLIPLALAVAGMTFYVVLLASGWSVREAEASGWLVGPLPGGSLWEPAALRALVSPDWWAVLAEAGSIATLLLFATIGLLLNSSAMEVALERDADLNGELRTAGVANLLAGASGGIVGYHALILAVLADRMNARSRVTGLTAAAVCVIVMLAGSSLLALIPKPVLGGLLLLVGLDLLITWTYDTRLRMPRGEHVVVLLIVAVMATGGLLQGVGVGFVAAAALFVVTYSRADIVKHTLTGASYQSAVDRPPEDQSVLRDHGDQTLIVVLQGFLFFGTASSLIGRVRNRLEDVERPTLRHLVVDFRRVTGLDTSAVQSFIRLHRRLQADGATLILAAVPPGVRRQLELGGLGEDARQGRRYAPDVDHAAQWCEEEVLAATSADARRTAGRRALLGGGDLDDRLLRYLDALHLAAGSCLIEEGADPDGLYFLAAGRLTVQLNGTDGTVTRLREIGAGAVVGELSHYLGITRTASVVAHEPSLVYRLSAEQMAAMERNSPELAAELHQQLAKLLAQRLTDTVRSLRALLD